MSPALAAELVEQVVDAGDLLDGIRGSGLLAVTEGCVGDEHGIGRAGDEECIVEFDAADMRIWEKRRGTVSGSTRLSSVRGREACF